MLLFLITLWSFMFDKYISDEGLIFVLLNLNIAILNLIG